jgi:predicted GIY-YIG superfamily endonuclease
MPREFYVYILASDSRELYVGITGNLVARVSQHRTGFKPIGYSAKHETKRLVYCEVTTTCKRLSVVRNKSKAGVGERSWN